MVADAHRSYSDDLVAAEVFRVKGLLLRQPTNGSLACQSYYNDGYCC
jgi:hypothetical protein